MNLRLVTAAAVLVSAAVHLYLYFDVFRDDNIIGPSFLLNFAGGVVIAGLLVWWRHWIPAFLALGFGVSTLGAFITSTTVGLFGVHEQWVGWPVWTAAISEAVAIVGGAVLLFQTFPRRSGSELENPQSTRGAHLH